MTKRKLLALMVGLAVSSSASHAMEDISLSGFFTTGLSVSDNEVIYRHDINDEVNFSGDTLVGVQLSAELTEKISATAQLVSRGEYDSGFSTTADWAYVAFDFSDNLRVRAGKFRSPLYLISDYQDVRFAQPWVRPPVEVYGPVPPSLATAEGVDLIYSMYVGDYTIELQPYVRRTAFEATVRQMPLEGETKAFTGLNINFTGVHGNLRLGHVETKIDFKPFFNSDIMGLFSQLTQLGAIPSTLNTIDGDYATITRTGSVDLKEFDASFSSIGGSFDLGNWLLMAEVAKVKTDAPLVPDTTGSYLTVGYRMGQFTPSLTLAQADPDDAGGWDQKSTTLGLRYDASSNVSMKINLQSIDAEQSTPDESLIPNVPPTPIYGYFDSDPGDTVNVLSMSVDVVF